MAATTDTDRQPRVLIVEDDDSLRLLCRINLELEGYRIAEARSIAEAEDVLASDAVALVLLDVHVGADDGIELMRSLRRRGHPAPVVIFSGSAQIDAATSAEADDVVPKPFQLEKLLGVVERFVRR